MKTTQYVQEKAISPSWVAPVVAYVVTVLGLAAVWWFAGLLAFATVVFVLVQLCLVRVPASKSCGPRVDDSTLGEGPAANSPLERYGHALAGGSLGPPFPRD